MSSPFAEAADSPAAGAAARAGRAVSTWSLHRTLGSFYADDPVGADRAATRGAAATTSGLPLLELPAELARRGYDTVQICHFHLPTRAPSYLDELRSSLRDAGVTLDAVLVDDGDLVHPQDADAHQAWIGGWLDDASTLGARRARVVAGKQPPTPERLRDSSRRLVQLAKDHPEIRVVTENWLALLPTAADVHAVLDPADGGVGFLIDLGNWTGADKYDELAAVAALAETCHSKCRFDADGPDSIDYRHSLQVLRDSGYAGPLALIYDGPDDDEWAALDREHEITREVFG